MKLLRYAWIDLLLWLLTIVLLTPFIWQLLAWILFALNW